MAHQAVERVRCSIFNTRNLLSRNELMGKGVDRRSPVYVREVTGRDGPGVGGDHPGPPTILGRPDPAAPISNHAQVRRQGNAHIALHDHIIIAPAPFKSRAMGLSEGGFRDDSKLTRFWGEIGVLKFSEIS